LKAKLNDRVEVVQDENDELNMEDDVFQVSELIDSYRVAPSIDLDKNLKIYIFDNIFVDVNIEELKTREVHSDIFMLFLLYMQIVKLLVI
jgi:hypothetical protein